MSAFLEIQDVFKSYFLHGKRIALHAQCLNDRHAVFAGGRRQRLAKRAACVADGKRRSRQLQIRSAAENARLSKSRSGKSKRMQRSAGRYPDKEYKDENAYEKPGIVYLHREILSNFSEKSLKLLADNTFVAPRSFDTSFLHNKRVGTFTADEYRIAWARDA